MTKARLTPTTDRRTAVRRVTRYGGRRATDQDERSAEANKASITNSIKALKIAVLRLPSSQRAAKVAELVRRLEFALANGDDVMAQVIALVQAIQRALDDEPWAQLDRIAQRLGRELSGRHPHTR